MINYSADVEYSGLFICITNDQLFSGINPLIIRFREVPVNSGFPDILNISNPADVECSELSICITNDQLYR